MSIASRQIRRTDLLHKNRDGPQIGDDVVQHQHEHVFTRRKTEDEKPDGWRLFQKKWLLHLCCEEVAQAAGLSCRKINAPHVLSGVDVFHELDPLRGFTAFPGKNCAQHSMTLDDLLLSQLSAHQDERAALLEMAVPEQMRSTPPKSAPADSNKPPPYPAWLPAIVEFRM